MIRQIRLTNSDLEKIFDGVDVDGFIRYTNSTPIINKGPDGWHITEFKFCYVGIDLAYLRGDLLTGMVFSKENIWESEILGEREYMIIPKPTTSTPFK